MYNISLSTLINGIILAISFIIFPLFGFSKKINIRILYSIIIPSLLIIFGYSINIMLFLSDTSSLSVLAIFLPWGVLINIPYLIKADSISISLLWSYFNKCMILLTITSLVDYFGMSNGYIKPTTFVYQGGEYVKGYFSIMYASIYNGELSYRLYGSFAEPGTFAMWLIPVTILSFLKKQYVFLLIYSIAMFFTYSLGGYISIALAFSLLFILNSKKNIISLLFIAICIAFVFNFLLLDYFIDAYVNKQESATIREDNFSNFIIYLPDLIISYPFGLSPETNSESNNALYFGSNFMPLLVYNRGGLLSLFGYVTILSSSLVYALKLYIQNKKNIEIEEKMVIISIISIFPFIFQRTTIWDSAMFALLFSPYIIRSLSKGYRFL